MKDYIGQKFGRLTIKDIIYKEQKGRNRKFAVCDCDCGKEHITRLDGILNNKTFSCGCQKNDHNKGKNYKHFSYGTRLYNIYSSMKQRCYCVSCTCYKYYGGRGITVCDEWKNDFSAFKKWALENGYSDSLTIDRINVNGNYEPNNCRWATKAQQSRNTRRTHFLTYNGITKCLTDWADFLNVNRGTFISGIGRGRTLEFYINKYSKRLEGRNEEKQLFFEGLI